MDGNFTGGCEHVSTFCRAEPIDSHICHCSVCKTVTGQSSTHVVFFKFNDVDVKNQDKLVRQPFNVNNPNGPLELCVCSVCSSPIMLDDKESRIRVIVPNLMGHDPISMPATYHAFFDPSKGGSLPDDGRPVYDALRPDFTWPAGQ
ncbi:GFA family protein [Zhongshania marina]|uniref:CENP-V/GFA domain-containing protein n=1 Tax=Zhongshania marina TaxID=2304603 RepID=A0A2S4HKI3_9GAMM|nr:GFA family protein [Marortus luteolus]POP54493.1 hypothetical protein C0068_01530 [Marortus luteolus]